VAYYYEILGLDSPPEDLKTAKKAYAQKLRATRPDEDPDGFMQLREAFDIAKQEIAYNLAHNDEADNHPAPLADSPSLDMEENSKADKQDTAAQPLTASNLAAKTSPDETSDIENIEQTGDQILMARLSKAMSDPFLKTNKAHLSAIFDDKADLSIDEYIDFDLRLRNWLIDIYNQWIEDKSKDKTKRRPFTPLIENLIFDKMDWRFLQDTESYKSQQIEWLKSQMDLFNRPAPKELQHAHQTSGANQSQEFEDDGLGLPTLIWRVIRTVLIFIVITNIFKLFSG